MDLTLHLPIKAKWNGMIESGEKPEEYRKITPYWAKRLTEDCRWCGENCGCCRFNCDRFDPGENDSVDFLPIKRVQFHNYREKLGLYEVESIRIGYGNPAWGAPEDEEVFIIKLGRRVS